MRILLVDDNRTNLMFLGKLVEKAGYQHIAYDSPERLVADLPAIEFDIAVIDYVMPGFNGVELLRRIGTVDRHRQKPVIFVTADTDTETRMAALDAGAIDFLTKPVSPLEFQARLRNIAALTEARNRLADKANWLRMEVARAVEELRAREEEVIERLSIAAAYKDKGTGWHMKRVAAYSEAIARAAGLDEDYCHDIRLASLMHDIGKVAIPDAVLLKAGPLSDEELDEVRRHTTVGGDILRDAKSALLKMAADIATGHHERWDGTGYPVGLFGDDIPLPARIVAIADTFDALATERPYKKAWRIEDAVAHIRMKAGLYFDPVCVAAFERALPTILEARETLADPAG